MSAGRDLPIPEMPFTEEFAKRRSRAGEGAGEERSAAGAELADGPGGAIDKGMGDARVRLHFQQLPIK